MKTTLKLQRVFFPLALVFGFLISSCGESLYTGELESDDRVYKEFDMNSNGTVPAYDKDYWTWEGTWAINNGELDFDSEPNGNKSSEGKLQFPNTFMRNGKVEMDIRIDGVYNDPNGNLKGNAGILIRSDNYEAGGDKVNGYYVGIGYDSGGVGDYYVLAGWVHGTYVPLKWDGAGIEEGGLTTAVSPGTYVHLAVQMVGKKATVTVTDTTTGANLFTDTFSHEDRGDTFAGIRAWQCTGKIDNIKITNIGKDLDFPN